MVGVMRGQVNESRGVGGGSRGLLANRHYTHSRVVSVIVYINDYINDSEFRVRRRCLREDLTCAGRSRTARKTRVRSFRGTGGGTNIQLEFRR